MIRRWLCRRLCRDAKVLTSLKEHRGDNGALILTTDWSGTCRFTGRWITMYTDGTWRYDD